MKLTEGTISGDDIRFTVVRTGNGDEFQVQFSGKVQGDSMKLQMEYKDHPAIALSAKRRYNASFSRNSQMSNQFSRRHFAGALGAGVLLSQPPGRHKRRKGPNDQVVLGMIGVGSQGTGRLREFLKLPDVRIAAICDVDRGHADRAVGYRREGERLQAARFRRFPTSCSTRRKSTRSRLSRPITGTRFPPSWPSRPARTSSSRSRSATASPKGRAMADASLNHKRVTQMGNHIHNDHANYRRVVEIVKSGKLGKITRVHAWKTSPTQNLRVRNPDTLPAGFDYDFWLGLRPSTPYDPLRSHGSYPPLLGLLRRHVHRFLVPHHRRRVLGDGLQSAQSILSPSGGRYFLTDQHRDGRHAGSDPRVSERALHVQLPADAASRLRAHGPDRMCCSKGSEASLVTNYETHEVWVEGQEGR